jgi:hypothetical protein
MFLIFTHNHPDDICKECLQLCMKQHIVAIRGGCSLQPTAFETDFT